MTANEADYMGDPRFKTTVPHQDSFQYAFETVIQSRSLFERGVIIADRGREDMQALARDDERMAQIETLLRDYEKRWQTPLSSPLPRTLAITDMILSHPFTKNGLGKSTIPLAGLMDIANRSSHGLYTGPVAMLGREDEQIERSPFATLPQLSAQWRSIMERHTQAIAQRFYAQNVQFNIIMMGDGSGMLGASQMKAVMHGDQEAKLVHIDVSDAFLDKQRETYERAGINSKRIVSIQADVTRMDYVLYERGIRSGFIMAHEVLDTLRSHSLFIGADSVKELHFSLPSGTVETIGTAEEMLRRVPEFFPWYRHGEGRHFTPTTEKMAPFSPLWLRAIEQMAASLKQSVIYIGDYNDRFVREKFDEEPMRVYPSRRGFDQHDYTHVFDVPVDMTTDVPPAILHLAPRWGAKVDFVGTQEQFLSIIDPWVSKSINERLKYVEEKLKRGYKPNAEDRQFFADALFVVEVGSPGMFGALLSKGV